jgi:SH3-like domain-containing protein
MQKPLDMRLVSTKGHITLSALLFAVILLVDLAGCGSGASDRTEYAYVAVTEAGLRDRVATIYTKTGILHNGERVQVLERMQSKRFVRVRSPRGEEGWVQERYLADQQTYDQFQRLAEQFKEAAAQSVATTEDQVKVHVLAGRKTGYLYLLNEKQKVDLLQRQTVDRNAPPAQLAPPGKLKDDKQQKEADADSSDDDQPKTGDSAGQPAIREDWWLIRDAQKRVGWVLGRALYLEVPDDIAQYAEGQRIVAIFRLDEVSDAGKKISQYLVLLTENHEGLPYDFSQIRVYTWNTRRHRYETAYRERDLLGALPVSMGQQNFAKEGSLRTFTLRLKDQDGKVRQQVYKFNPPIVRKFFAPGEEPPKTHHRRGTRPK